MGTGSEPSSIWCPKPKFHPLHHLNFLNSDWNPCVYNHLKSAGWWSLWIAVFSPHPSPPLPSHMGVLQGVEFYPHLHGTLTATTHPACVLALCLKTTKSRIQGRKVPTVIQQFCPTLDSRHVSILAFLMHSFHKHLMIISIWTMKGLKATEMCVVEWELLPTRKLNVHYRNRHANQTFMNK